MSERAQGRIVNVWTTPVSTPLTQNEIATATVLHVEDASIFNDDGDGGLLIKGATFSNGEYVTGTGQVIAYTAVDDDVSTVTLAVGLTTAADEDDPIYVWSDLYGLPDTRQYAAVQPDGRGDGADDIEAVVDDELELVDGDRGKRGEACTIVRRPGSDDWTVKSVRGRPKKARGMKAEANDTYILTTADKTAGSATIPLTYVPVDESVKLVYGGVPQRPSNYTVNYDAKTITFPLTGWEPAGLRFWVHYWYVRGPVPATPPVSFRGQDTAFYTSTITSPLVVSPVDAGAVQGDVFVLAVAATGTTTFSDPRIVATITMPDTDFDLVWGRLTTGGGTNWNDPFSVSTDSSTVWGAAVALACYEAGDVTQIAGPGTSGTSPISLPTVASAAFVVGVVHLQNGFAAGTELSETGGGGYTRACFAEGTKVSVAIFHKAISPAAANPASAFSTSGSLGTLNATTLVVTP